MKNKINELSDEFDNGQADHFTHYDYLKQLIDNGQFSALKNHLETMSNSALLTMYRIVSPSDDYSEGSKGIVRNEIINRMEK